MNQQIRIALLLSFIAGLFIIGISLIWGRIPVFHLLNHDLGNSADQFFRYYTHMGDGMIWIPVALLTIVFKRQWTLLVLTCIISSTLVAQVSKNLFFKGVTRPSLAIQAPDSYHQVAGVELHTLNSFPSGHSTTAFTIFLLAVILFPKQRWVLPLGFALALLAGYSRVYLAQHFPIDVGGGMVSAVLAILLAWPVHQKWQAKLTVRSYKDPKDSR